MGDGIDDLAVSRALLLAAWPAVRELIADQLDAHALEVAMVDANGGVLVAEPEIVGSDVEPLAAVAETGEPIASRRAVGVPIRGSDLDGDVVGAFGIRGEALDGWPLGPVLIRALGEVLRRELADTRPPPGRSTLPVLRVLGMATGSLELPRHDGGRNVDLRLSLRHSEILLALAHHREGLSTRELGNLLYTGPVPEVTIRAEITRLRRVIGPLLAWSRPYRLGPPVETDVSRLLNRLSAGDATGALDAYGGPVLSDSVAPWVVELRATVVSELRRVVLRSRNPEAIARLEKLDPDL